MGREGGLAQRFGTKLGRYLTGGVLGWAMGGCTRWKSWGLRWCRNKAWVLSLGWRGWNNKGESLFQSAA